MWNLILISRATYDFYDSLVHLNMEIHVIDIL